MSPNFMIKDYEDSNLKEASMLFKNVFGKDMDPDYFKWKNHNNPNGRSIVKITMDGEKMIGFCSIWRFKMSLLGESISAGQSVDAMVDRNYRKMGIFENMALEALEDMKREDIELRFNFPNEAAYQASIRKVNIKKVCNIPQYIKALKGKEAFSMFSGNRLLKIAGGILLDLYTGMRNITAKKTSAYEIREIQRFDHGFDEFWQKVKNDYPIVVERSAQYLNWRFKSSPGIYKIYAAYIDDEIAGYIVVAIESKVGKDGKELLMGHIADLMCSKDHKAVAGQLINKAEKYLMSKGACAVSCWMIKEWFYSDILTNLAYLQLRSPSVLAALPVGDRVKAMGDFIYDHKNWYVTIGDSDYI